MAIDTTNKKLGLINLMMPFQPNLPVSPGSLGQDDKQQLLWGYPGILWGAVVQVFHWVVPTNAPDGTAAELVILADDWQSVLDTGQATALSGEWEFTSNITPGAGDKRLAFWHQWDQDPETQSIFGGAAIAEAVLQ